MNNTDTTSGVFGSRADVTTVIEAILLFLWGVFFLLFPFIISSQTTNAFILPKQFFLLGIIVLSLVAWGIKMVTEKTVLIRKTPFTIPVLLFSFFSLLSTLFAVNRYDSLIGFVPLLTIILLYFMIANLARKENTILFLLSSLIVSGSILSIFTIFSFLNVYLLPFAYTHNASFTFMGSYLEQAIYLLCILPIAIYFTHPLLKGKFHGRPIFFGVSAIIIIWGLIFSIINLITVQKLVILPFETGFQIAFAAISQDTGRIFQGFFLGSGFGTFFADFTRFKPASFNGNQTLWYQTFFQSSSFVLELLTTTGILGFLAFLSIIVKIFRPYAKVKKNPFVVSLIIAVIIFFVLPVGFTTSTLFFILLALFGGIEALRHEDKYPDVKLRTVAYKKSAHAEEISSKSGLSISISLFACIIFFSIAGFLGYYATKFALSDIYFAQSIITASQNNGIQTYQNQIKAIDQFPYRDMYYRGFSQTNFALANSIAALASKDKKLTQTQQQTMYTLIQQSIKTGRIATEYAPETVTNWQNLSSIYRALIGFGQNAEQFALVTNQQAVTLDPANPQEYISLGGLYYQLKQYDTAIIQFQTAARLKPDLANAYYNWGHALQEKGDLTNALTAYQQVKTLVANDSANKKKIEGEITALQEQIKNTSQANSGKGNNQQVPQNGVTPVPQQEQTPLGVNKPSTVIPTRNPQVKLPAPSVKTPTPTVGQ